MTQLTERQKSILKMLATMKQAKHMGLDWDDHLSDQVSRIPGIEALPGIKQEEYDTLMDAYSCPRAALSVVHKLEGEVEKVHIDGTSEIDEAVKKADTLLKELKKLQVEIKSGEKPVESFYKLGCFAELDKVSIPQEDLEYEVDVSYEGDGTLMMPKKKVKILLEVELEE